jgi:VanZ family protein
MRWLSRLCFFAWLVLLVVGSLLPRIPPAGAVMRFHGAAYVAHGIGYAILCALAAWALGPRSGCALLLTALGAFLLGVAIEYIQPLTGRSFDRADMAANAAGAVTGLVITVLARRAARRRAACGRVPRAG